MDTKVSQVDILLGALLVLVLWRRTWWGNKRRITRLFIAFLPLIVAAFVGVSQLNDYYHHWQDVLAGSLLGMMVASICYLQLFPLPHFLDGWAPYQLYFDAMADSAELRNPATYCQSPTLARVNNINQFIKSGQSSPSKPVF